MARLGRCRGSSAALRARFKAQWLITLRLISAITSWWSLTCTLLGRAVGFRHQDVAANPVSFLVAASIAISHIALVTVRTDTSSPPSAS